MEFKKTIKQIRAIRLLASKAKHIMLYGGSRSGKTFIIVFAILVRACKCKSKHIMVRKTFNSIKTSIWMDTLVKVLNICFPLLEVSWNNSNYYIRLFNGSEIWIGGLDDDRRVEKHLGKEYSTIFFNECSQLSYTSIQVLLTRLAEKNSLVKKAYYDENPPSKKHWSYWLFIKKLDPIENEPLKNDEDYACMVMNPTDNLDNIDENYITDVLDNMPEKQRRRFKDGEFVEDDDGIVYYEFDREKHVKATEFENGTVFLAMDFNVNPMTAIIFQVFHDQIHVHDEVYLENSDTPKMCKELQSRGYAGLKVIPDSTAKNRKTSGKSDLIILKEHGFQVIPTRNPYVVDRVNAVNRMFSQDRLVINRRCKKLINDLEKVAWRNGELDQKGENSMLTHISDALGYGVWKHFPIASDIKPITISRYI